MKKKFLILGTLSLAAIGAAGVVGLREAPSFVHATDNLSIKLTYENVTNVDYDEYYGYLFDLTTTTTFNNAYLVEQVNVYASGSATVYTKTSPHADGRLFEYDAGGYSYFQISNQTYSNVSINSVSLLVSVDGGEKETVSWGFNNDVEHSSWLMYFDNAYSDAPEHNKLVVYEINISYNCQIM